MATITAPTDNVYVFDPIIMTIDGSGSYTMNIAGVKTLVSTIEGTASIDIRYILQSLFTLYELAADTVSKVINWSVSQDNTEVGSGSFTAIYGSNKSIAFDSEDITLKWIARDGSIKTKEFCIYQTGSKLENIKSASFDGLTHKISFDKESKITLYAALIEKEEYSSLIEIQESEVVQVLTSDGYVKVSVDAQEYKVTKEVLQDFNITVVLPYEG